MVEVNKASPIRGQLGKRSKAAKLVSDSETEAAAYKRLFATRDGKVVLDDLSKRFYDMEIDNEQAHRAIGRRDVVHFIKRRVTLK